MDKQISLFGLGDKLSSGTDEEKRFSEQIERIVPWSEWEAMIRPCYYKGECGNKPYRSKWMPRLYLLQNLYGLSDEATVS